MPDRSTEPSIATPPARSLYVSAVAPLVDTDVTWMAGGTYSLIVIVIPLKSMFAPSVPLIVSLIVAEIGDDGVISDGLIVPYGI